MIKTEKNTMSHVTTLLSTSSAKVSNALKVFSQLQEKREGELAGIPTEAIHNESDVENDSSYTNCDRFCAKGGSQTLIDMSNLSYNKFEGLWHCCDTILTQGCTTNGNLKGEILDKIRTHASEAFSHAVKILSPYLFQDFLS